MSYNLVNYIQLLSTKNCQKNKIVAFHIRFIKFIHLFIHLHLLFLLLRYYSIAFQNSLWKIEKLVTKNTRHP